LAKKKAEEPKHEFTKRQLARWQKERKRQRLIFITGTVIIAAVIAIIGAGWYVSHYRPLHQTVMVVNGAKFDMDYYIKMLSYYGKGQSIQTVQSLADFVPEMIKRQELAKQAASELGITVSDDEVDERLSSFDPPLSKDYRDVIEAQVLYDKLRNEYFDKQVPVFAEQRHIMGMLLESESQAEEVKARLESGDSFAELAGELSLEDFSKNEEGDLGWRPKGILTMLLGTSVPDEYAFNSEVGVLSEPVYDETVNKRLGYWLIKVLARDEAIKQAYVQVILLGSKEEALDIRARLEAGEDFAALAEEFSEHELSKQNGGKLDVTSPDMMSEAFNDFVFDSETEIGTLSQPIRDDTVTTSGGYWLLKVVDKDDNRRLEEQDREMLKTDAMNKWIQALLDNPENEVEIYLDNEQKAWAIERAIGA